MLDDYATIISKHTVFVAELDEIIGILVLIRTNTGMLLDNVAVHPEFQGKGLGRRLLELAESETHHQGFDALDLYTHECMTENIEMYRALGYIEMHQKREHGYDRVYMQKSLSRTGLGQ